MGVDYMICDACHEITNDCVGNFIIDEEVLVCPECAKELQDSGCIIKVDDMWIAIHPFRVFQCEYGWHEPKYPSDEEEKSGPKVDGAGDKASGCVD